MTVRLIFAQSSNGFIGKDNELLFRLPEDMAIFREKTQGSTVIMGRKTWMSIPKKFRPLKGRRNVVLTSSTDLDAFEGAQVYRELKQAIADSSGSGPIWIIGGERLYNEGLALADEIHETLVHQTFEGDARAPVIDHKLWTRVRSSPDKEFEGLVYQFNIYVRKDHHDEIQVQEAPSQEGSAVGALDAEIPSEPGHHLGSDHRCAPEEGQGRRVVAIDSSDRSSGQGCAGTCGEDDRARCVEASRQAGLEAR